MERLDDLLAQALATGEIPADASEAERAELTRLLSPAASLRLEAREVQREAVASMPIARARFQRFVATETQPAPAHASVFAPRPGFLSRFFSIHRGLASAGAAVAVGIVAVVALFASQSLLSGTETANALTVDDYVQVQGVISSTTGAGGDQQVHITSEYGPLTVSVSADTTRADELAAAPSLKAGDSILVAGVVQKDRSISAQTVAAAAEQSAPPKKLAARELKKLLPNLEGRIVLFAVARDGATARVLLESAGGQRYLVTVDGKTAATLLNRAATAVGLRVKVGEGARPNDGVFDLAITEPATDPTAAPTGSPTSRPALSLAGARGVVIGREGNVIQVLDAVQRRTVAIVLRPESRVLLGESGLTREAATRSDAIIGHTVAVTGGIDAKSKRIVADVIVIGPRLGR